MGLFICISSRRWSPINLLGCVAALGLGALVVTACAGSHPNETQPNQIQPAEVTPIATAVPPTTVAASQAVAPIRPSSPLVTNSGINLSGAANPLPQSQESEPDLRQFQTPKGTRVLIPSSWTSQAPVSLSQKVCADRCITIDEALQLFVSADGENAVGVMSMALPIDTPSDAASLLPGAVRGSIAALSATGASTNILEGPQPATVANSTRALSERAAMVDPTSGQSATVTVLAAAGDREIDALLIGVSDAYQRDHQAYIDRIRASFNLGGPAQ